MVSDELRELAEQLSSEKGKTSSLPEPLTLSVDLEARMQAIAELNAELLWHKHGEELWCDICNGLGVVKEAIGQGQPLVYCPDPNCHIARKMRRDRLDVMLNNYESIPEIYQKFDFETWADLNPIYHKEKRLAELALHYMVANPLSTFSIADMLNSPQAIEIFDGEVKTEIIKANLKSKDEAEHDERVRMRVGDFGTFIFPNSIGSGVVLSGAKGVGKTGLSIATAYALIDAGYAVAYIHLPDFIDSIKFTYKNNYQGKSLADIVKPIAQAEVLIVDEFGTSGDRFSDHDIRVIENYIVTPRWNSHKPMLITTNETPASFEDKIGDLAATRIFEMCHWIPVTGRVIRRKNKPIIGVQSE